MIAYNFTVGRYCTFDTTNTAYFTEENKIVRVTTDGTVTTVAGSITGVSGSNDGIGTASKFALNAGITYNSDLNVFYIANLGYGIRRMTNDGIFTVTTIVSNVLTYYWTVLTYHNSFLYALNAITCTISAINVGDGSFNVSTYAGTKCLPSVSSETKYDQNNDRLTAVLSNYVYSIASDNFGNIYIESNNYLSVIYGNNMNS